MYTETNKSNKMNAHLSIIRDMLRNGHGSILAREVLRRLYSKRISYGFHYDLSVEVDVPAPDIPIRIRRFEKEDVRVLLNPRDAKSFIEAKNRYIRLSMVRAGFENCYIATTQGGQPVHLQWMLGPEENDKIHAFSGGGLQPLAPDEVLLENVFTLESFRRKGIELWVIKQLLQLAGKNGANRAVVYIQADNVVSLKMIKRIGFEPAFIKKDRRICFYPKFMFDRL